MSLSSTTSRVSYAGNGATTAFSFPYYFLSNSDLVVILRVDSTGVETTKTITTHYTVSGAGVGAGGTVTMLAAPASGETLVIYRSPALTQGIDLGENDSLPAETLEQGLDKVTMIAQRLDDRIDRSVQLSDGFAETFDPTLPADLDQAGGLVPAINAGGTGWAAIADWPAASALTSASAISTAIATHAALTATHGVAGAIVGTTDSQTLTNKTIVAGSNSISGIVNANVDAAAGIVDTKLATISTAGKVSNSATTAASANTASAIVARDGSGNFTAGTITASLSGNVTGNITGNVTGDVTGNIVLGAGSVSAPSASFTGDANTGLYSSAADKIEVVAGGQTGLQVGKSTGSFANVGMGSSASSSDNYPVLISRSSSSAGTYLQVANPSTSANAKATLELSTDAGANTGEVSVYTAASTVDAYIDAMVVRATGGTGKLALANGTASTYVTTYAGGLTSASEVLRFNADSSVQLMQQISTPTTPAAGIKIYTKSDKKLYTVDTTGLERELGAASTASLTITSISNSDSPYTALVATDLLLVNATAGAVTVNLPTAVGNSGKTFRIRKTDSSTNAVTVDGDGTETINGSTTKLLISQHEEITIISDNSNWIVSAYVSPAFSSASRLRASATGLTTGTGANITSISLQPGEWDLVGQVGFDHGSSTNVTSYQIALSRTSATLSGTDSLAAPNSDGEVRTSFNSAGVVTSADQAFNCHSRVVITSATTFYLVADCNFTVSTLTGYGSISARRIAP